MSFFSENKLTINRSPEYNKAAAPNSRQLIGSSSIGVYKMDHDQVSWRADKAASA